MHAYITAEGIENARTLGDDKAFMSLLADELFEGEDYDNNFQKITQCNFLGLFIQDNKIWGDWELIFEDGHIEEFTAPLDREGNIAW